MNKVLVALAVGFVLTLAGCASSTQQASVQLPGETARNGLQVPPGAGERPVQVAAAPAR